MDEEARRLEAERMRAAGVNQNFAQHNNFNVLPSLHQNIAPNQPPLSRLLMDYLQPTENRLPIMQRGPNVAYQIDPAFINIVQNNQFGGGVSENPNLHLERFEKLCQIINIQGLSAEDLRLHLFPFSLRDRAQTWLDSVAPESITTWDEMVRRFMTKFFPPSKIMQMRARITGFKQKPNEIVAEAWERLRGYLRACPLHGFDNSTLMHIFYQSLTSQNRQLLNASSGGTFMSKTADEARQILDAIAEDVELWGAGERNTPTKADMYEVGPSTLLDAKLDMVVSRLEKLEVSMTKKATEVPKASTSQLVVGIVTCQFCGGPHFTHECPSAANNQSVEEVQYMQNQNRGPINPHTNTPLFQYQRHQGPPGFQQRQYYQNTNEQQKLKEDNELKDMIKQSIRVQTDSTKAFNEYMPRIDAELTQQRSSIKNLEQHIENLIAQFNQRNLGALPSDTEINLREPLTDEVEPEEWDSHRFEDSDTQSRYFELQRSRTVIPERGIGAEYFDDDRLQTILQWLGWEQFATHPTNYGSLKLAIEVFAQFPKVTPFGGRGEEEHMEIRGENVVVSADRINRVLGLPRESPNTYYPEISMPQGEHIGRALGIEGRMVLNPINGNEFKTKHIMTPWKELAMLWLGRVQPTSRDHYISFTMAQYIYGIARGERPNIGAIILSNMRDIAQSSHPSLTYVHLITELCRQQEVPISDDECTFRPDGAIKIMGYQIRKADLQAGRNLPAILVPPQDPIPKVEFILQQPPIPLQADREDAVSPPPPPQHRGHQGGYHPDMYDQLVQFMRDADVRWAIVLENQRMMDMFMQTLQRNTHTIQGAMHNIQGDMRNIQGDIRNIRRGIQSIVRGLRHTLPNFDDGEAGQSEPRQPNRRGRRYD